MTNETLVGYKIVRILEETPRSSTLLAQRVESGQAEKHGHSDQLGPSSTGLVTLRCYREGVSFSNVLMECDAMTAISSPHLVSLYDIASVGENSTIAVCEWVPGIALSKLLKTREYLRVGEAITILAPLIDIVSRLHGLGIIHGGIRAESICFRASGSPVLTELAQARRITQNPTPAVLSGDSLVKSDIAAIVRLCTIVLSAVRDDPSRRQHSSACIDWLSSTSLSDSSEWAADLETSLFGLGAPEPVRFVTELSASAPSPQLPRGIGVSAGDPTEQAEAPGDSITLFGFPSWLQAELLRVFAAVRRYAHDARASVIRWLAPVRPRAWVLAGIAGVAIVAAMLVSGLTISEPEESTASELQPTLSTSEPTASAASSNPERALEELLTARERCFQELSVECLHDVESVDSPAFAVDSAVIAGVVDGQEFAEPVLLRFNDFLTEQELGDSILFSLDLVANDKPASVLLVKGEAGWRIRSYALPK